IITASWPYVYYSYIIPTLVVPSRPGCALLATLRRLLAHPLSGTYPGKIEATHHRRCGDTVMIPWARQHPAAHGTRPAGRLYRACNCAPRHAPCPCRRGRRRDWTPGGRRAARTWG